MAPKKRQTRMDAAYDHLCPLGFSKPLIRSKVNSLLKVYGEEGWAFFEADAYSVLLEAILEEQDKHSQKIGPMDDEAASTSNQQPNQQSSQQPNQVVETEHACTESEPEPKLERKLKRKLKRKLDPEFDTEPEPKLERKLKQKLEPEFDTEPDVIGLPPPSTPLQEPVPGPPRRKRKPCYGWISSDDEELDLVFLETEFSLLRKNCRSDCRKRKSGWDIKPEDM